MCFMLFEKQDPNSVYAVEMLQRQMITKVLRFLIQMSKRIQMYLNVCVRS